MNTAVGTFNYAYDILGRLTGIQNHRGEVFGFSYDLGNRMTSTDRPGSKTFYQFDANNNLLGIDHKKGTSSIEELIYSRDVLGQAIEISKTSGVQAYSYDANNQLSQATNSSLTGNYSQETFSYDSLGNRTSDEFGSTSYDQTRQRIEEDVNYLYVHDNNGNLITRQGKGSLLGQVRQFIYSSENQLVGIRDYEGVTLLKSINYAYNVLGQRIEKDIVDHQHPEKSFIRRYVYHDNEVLHELDGENQIISTYTHSTQRTDDVLAVENSQGSYFFLKDALGSITHLTDSTGSKVQSYVYSSFGKLLRVEDGNGNDVTNAPTIAPYFTYTGREWDVESGLYYYRARYYDPDTGRFVQVDPDAGTLSNPMTHINKYAYVLNNPILYVDSTGKTAEEIDYQAQGQDQKQETLLDVLIPEIHGRFCGNGNNRPSYDDFSNRQAEGSLDEACLKHDRAYAGDFTAFLVIDNSERTKAQMRTDADLAYRGTIHATESLFQGDLHGVVDGILIGHFGGALFLWSSHRYAISFVWEGLGL